MWLTDLFKGEHLRMFISRLTLKEIGDKVKTRENHLYRHWRREAGKEETQVDQKRHFRSCLFSPRFPPPPQSRGCPTLGIFASTSLVQLVPFPFMCMLSCQIMRTDTKMCFSLSHFAFVWIICHHRLVLTNMHGRTFLVMNTASNSIWSWEPN